MKFTSITIGGGNKNFFLSEVSFETILLIILKNKNITSHIHIGNIPKIRLIFLYILLYLNNIPNNKFVYKGQLKDINLLKKYKKAIVISSAPLVGSMTILECWKLKLPVLIYKPKDYYIDFSTFLKKEDLLWENIYELNLKINNVMNNFEKFSKEYYDHFKFLQLDSKKTNNFLKRNSKKIYKLHFKKENNKNLFKSKLRIFASFFKPFYLCAKVFILINTLYIRPILKKYFQFL